MHFLADLCLAVAGASLLFLFIGLYKPWVMLWWEDTQNRKKVIKVYGLTAVVFYLSYLILSTL